MTPASFPPLSLIILFSVSLSFAQDTDEPWNNSSSLTSVSPLGFQETTESAVSNTSSTISDSLTDLTVVPTSESSTNSSTASTSTASSSSSPPASSTTQFFTTMDLFSTVNATRAENMSSSTTRMAQSGGYEQERLKRVLAMGIALPLGLVFVMSVLYCVYEKKIRRYQSFLQVRRSLGLEDYDIRSIWYRNQQLPRVTEVDEESALDEEKLRLRDSYVAPGSAAASPQPSNRCPSPLSDVT